MNREEDDLFVLESDNENSSAQAVVINEHRQLSARSDRREKVVLTGPGAHMHK